MVSTTRNMNRQQTAHPDAITTAHGSNYRKPSVRDVEDGISCGGEDFHHMEVDVQAGDLQDSAPNQEAEDIAEIKSLAVDVKDALSTINTLQCLGLQNLEIPLPKCIVLGDQSAGKSSVIEAISGIKTPREDDTCTRCPLFITMEPSTNTNTSWSARVSLRRDFAWDGRMSTRPTKRRFEGWVQLRRPEIIDFRTTCNRNELEDIIRRAQLALLSPTAEWSEFLEPSLDHLIGLQKTEFSPNVVCIAISEQNLPSLSFYDLPGIIGQAETAESGHLVQLVENLVTSYVEDKEALILLCCSLENDIATSQAAGIARREKAADRCIGVLTKPDRLAVGGQHQRLQQVFNGSRYALGHGYFTVKNLNQDEIKQRLTHQQARKLETEFFKHTAPWADILHDHASRFGTPRLQRFVSSQLAAQIIGKLPVIQREISLRLQRTEEELKQYPAPPSQNAVRIIGNIVQNFAQDVRKELEAEFPCTAWRSKWDTLQKDFFAELKSMKPSLSLSGDRDKDVYSQTLDLPGNGIYNDPFVINSDVEEWETEGNDYSPAASPNGKKRRLSGTPCSSPLKSAYSHVNPSPRVQPDLSEHRLKFQLDQLSKELEERSKTLIPGTIEHRVINAIMVESLRHWEKPLTTFLNTLEERIGKQMRDMFEQHFGKWQGSALYRTAWEIIVEMLQVNLHQQRTIMAADSLDDEKEGPFIFPKGKFDDEKAGMLNTYAQLRFNARMKRYKIEREKATAKPFTPAEEQRLHKNPNAMAILKHEPYKVEIDVVAQVTTYYLLAAPRFHNAICMRIQSKFFKQLRTQLRDELENRLGIHDEATGRTTAVDLLTADPEREQTRRELVAKREALLKGQQVLLDLQNKKYGDNDARASVAPSLDGSVYPLRGMHTLVSAGVEDEI